MEENVISARDAKLMRDALDRMVGHARSSESSDGTWTHVIREKDLDFARLVLSDCESAEKSEGTWLVIQAEDQESDGGIWTAVTEFTALDEAKKFAENVIRNEWAPLSTITTPDGVRNLADMPGYTYPPESVKWSKIHYSEDGMEAWYADRVENVYRKLSIVKAKKEGDRVC